MDQTFSQTALSKIFVHIPARTLAHWSKLGLIRWATETIDKRGIHRKYDLFNLYEVGLIEELTSLNFPYDVIKLFLPYMRDKEELGILKIQKIGCGRIRDDSPYSLEFIPRDKEISFKDMISKNRQGPSFIFIDLSIVAKCVDGYIKRALSIKEIINKKII